LTARVLVVLAVACLLTAGVAGLASAEITYYYDTLGRLVGVSDPASDTATATYQYDAVGNLLSVTRYASSTVSIIDFQPNTGPVGTVVTIQGTGFSSTPASNAVTFNGTAATVTSATATSLVVSVPAGATTGTIGVTAPAGSATSSSAFTVTATSGAPTITSFTPTIAAPGTTVTISGTNFEPVTTNNRVSFTGAPTPKTLVTAAATTALDAVVPTTARSGPIRVATPAGTAVSATDFFVPTGGFTAAQVAFTGRIAIGGASVDVAVTPGTIGLVVFDGVAGQRLDLGTTLIAGPPATAVTVYRPDGAVLPTTASTSSGVARYLSPLPMDGVYVIQVTALTFGYTLRLTLSGEVVVTAEVGGSSVNLSLTRAGQRGRVSFPATAGQRVSAGVTSNLSNLTLSLLDPTDAVLVALGTSMPNAIDSPALSTGTHALTIERSSAATVNVTATLSDEVTATLTVDGASVPIAISRPGQRARVTFTGTAGEGPSLGLTAATLSGAVTVYRPGGATHVGTTSYSAPAAGVDFPPFASTGTHEILIDPSGIATGSVTLTLSNPVIATTALDGTPLAVTITRPGQRAVVTFPGTANQRASHVLSGTSITGIFILMRPNGTVTHWPPLPSTTFVDAYALPLTGTYYMIIDPSAANTGSTTVTSYAVPPDVTGSLTINGGTVPVTLSAPGQNALLSFAATSGQAITVRITGNALGCVSVSIVPPGGGSIGGTWSCGASFNLTGSVVTTTGTHTVRIDPWGPDTGGVTVEVTNP
jgi:YD repeat-containing protein